MLGGSVESYSYSSVSSLQSYTNFCYPTQLCLNSEANIIPYVGYFNEGLYAEAAKTDLEDPLYAYPMSGVPKVRTDDKNKSTYCADIYERYVEYTDADKELREQYDKLHILQDIMQSGSFRLGPNNKSVYLFGGMFGLNNGYCKNVGYAGKFIFADNFVGLAGGIAGRQARGSFENVYSMPEFSFTSGAFDDVVTIQSNDSTFIEQVETIPCINASQITHDRLHIQIPDGACVLYYEVKGETTPATSALSSSKIIEYTSENVKAVIHNLEYITDISALNPMYVDRAGNEVTSARVFKLDYLDSLSVDSKHAELTVECSSFSDYLGGTTTAVSYISKLQFYNCYATYSQEDYNELYPWVSNTAEFVKINDTLHDITLVTPNSNVEVTIVTPLTDSASAVSTVVVPISSTTLDNTIGWDFRGDMLDTTATSAINVKLAPIIHAGGFCGEYIVTDTTEKSFTSSAKNINGQTILGIVSFDDTKLKNVHSQVAWTTDLPDNVSDRQYNLYNTVASFAADISLDTMNKSDCDTLSAYPYTSADSQRVTKFQNVFCNLHKGDIDDSWNSLITTADFVRYMNYTPDAMPSVIMSEPHGKEHAKGDTYEPNFGITWLDQLFYKGKAYAHNKNEVTDAFVNSPAQASHSSAMDTQTIAAWENHALLYDTYFDFSYLNGDVRTACSAEVSSFITRQAHMTSDDADNEIDAPYQYTLGRIGYDKTRTNSDARYSFETVDDTYYEVTKAIICTATLDENDDASARLIDLIGANDSSHSNYIEPAYVYTYDSTTVKNSLPVIPLTIQYTDQYAFDKDLGTARPIDRYHINYAISAGEHRAFALSSNSYNTIYDYNKTYVEKLPVFMNGDFPLSSNDIVFGFIPNSADILKCLDQSVSTNLYCSGISANDLQYMLVVDENRHIVFDVKLDITAAENDGYVFEFSGIRTVNRVGGSYYAGDLSGLAINIAISGNNNV